MKQVTWSEAALCAVMMGKIYHSIRALLAAAAVSSASFTFVRSFHNNIIIRRYDEYIHLLLRTQFNQPASK